MRFSYHRPTSLDDALRLLAAGGAVLAGGQSLMPLVKRGDLAPGHLVDIDRVPGLDTITFETAGAIAPGGAAAGALVAGGDAIIIGARVRLEAVRTDPLVGAHAPLLAAALAWVANPAVRRRGTLVGNLVQNGAGAEAPAAVSLAEPRLLWRRGAEAGESPVGRLPAGALVLAVRLDARPAGTRAGFHEIQKRFGHLCTLGAGVELAPDGSVRAVLAGLLDPPFRSPAVDAALTAGRSGDAALAAALAHDLAGRPVRADIHATAAYRVAVAPVALRRALAAARAEAATA